MRVDAFDFDLPEDRIALRPMVPRDAGRMLVIPAGAPLADAAVADLPAWLRPGDALVFNDTRVLPARLRGVRRRPDGAVATPEILLHRRLAPERWLAFARPAKRLREGDRVAVTPADGADDAPALAAEVVARGEGGEVELRFDRAGADLDAAIARLGALPLPPYIAGKRPADARDAADYQTVYARAQGAVAAPTAGLHFTRDLLAQVEAAGARRLHVTLHVGAGTFLPVKAEDTADHRMHAEWGEVTPEVAEGLNAARAAGGRVVAVGTTSLRLLESAADPDGRLRPYRGATDIFITPGYRFRAVDVLLTNFHLPRSTLFMLVSAFAGLATMRAAYAHAIAARYRFYSYGDASLIVRAPRETP